MNRNFEDALKAAQDAESAFRGLRDTVGEVGDTDFGRFSMVFELETMIFR